jgi:GNAT superfamily N-acetyltransferase
VNEATATGELSLRRLEPADGPALRRCFERCYGDSYVHGLFYDVDEIRAHVADGRLRSVVAVTDGGEIVGHMGLTRRDDEGATADAGNTVVDPRYRNRKLAGRLGASLVQLSRDVGLVGFHHYPTTAHPILQKLAVLGGGIETGIMLEYIPAGTHYRELTDVAPSHRLAVVVVYQPIVAAPAREVFLPERYADLLRGMQASAGLERKPLPPAPSWLASVARAESRLDARRRVLRVWVDAAGEDLPEQVERITSPCNADVVQVDLALSDPGVDLAVESLRRLGFRFCALLPEWNEGDALRLQRTSGSSPPPELENAEARTLLRRILGE